MIDIKERIKICQIQIMANKKYGNRLAGRVKVKDEYGNIQYLNAPVKTDWKKELKLLSVS